MACRTGARICLWMRSAPVDKSTKPRRSQDVHPAVFGELADIPTGPHVFGHSVQRTRLEAYPLAT